LSADHRLGLHEYRATKSLDGAPDIGAGERGIPLLQELPVAILPGGHYIGIGRDEADRDEKDRQDDPFHSLDGITPDTRGLGSSTYRRLEPGTNGGF
jgi:hypothetical protein